MKTSIILAIALAISSSILAYAQTAATPKPAPTESKLPSGVTPKKVSPAKFQSEYGWVGKPQTMHEVTYLGQRDGRAYIKRNSMSSLSRTWTAHVIYVDLSELEPAFREALPKTALSDTK